MSVYQGQLPNCCDTWHQAACQHIKVNCPTTMVIATWTVQYHPHVGGNCNMDCAVSSACYFAGVNWSPDPYLNTLDCGTSNIGCLYDFTVPPTIRPTSVTQTPTTAYQGQLPNCW
eukprot:952788_1